MRSGTHYSAASVTALLALCGFDVIAIAGVREPRFLAGLGLLVLCLGGVHGLLWAFALDTSARLRPRLRTLLWSLAALAGCVLVSDALGAFTRLSGRYRLHALLVLLAASGGSAVLAALVLAMHGEAGGRPAWLLRSQGAQRLRFALILLAGCALLTVLDRVVYAALYPPLHVALRLSSLWLAMFGLVLVLRVPERPRAAVAIGLVALACGAGAAFVIRAKDATVLQAFALRPWPALLLETARALSDIDRDGYSALFGGGDCAPWNPRVSPGAREIPGNGIDDNCFLGDAKNARAAAIDQDAPLPSAPSPLDVVLITVDSLQAGHIGLYSNAYGASGRATTPALDRFARQQCVVFEHADAPGGGTSISVAAMFRGRNARRLQWKPFYETSGFSLIARGEKPAVGESIERMFPLAFDDPSRSLAEWLARRGMYTIAVADDGFSEMLTRGTGIERGFAQFHETDDLPLAQRDDSGTVDLVLRALASAPAGQRVFLWAHFFGTHAPNTHHPGARVYGTSLIDGYDHEINYFDMQFARLLQALQRRARPVALLIAADHGDVLENGRYHGYTLGDDVTHIPFLLCVPGRLPKRVTQPVSLIDVLPTILGLTQTPAPQGLDGLDLAPLIAGERPWPHDRVLLSDSWLYTAAGKPRVNIVAARSPRGKIVLDLITGALSPAFSHASAGETTRLRARIDGYLEETGRTLDLH